MIPKILFSIGSSSLKNIILLTFIFTSTLLSQSDSAEEYVKKAIFFQTKYNSEFLEQNLDSSSYYYEKARELFKICRDWEHYVNVSIRLAHAHSFLDKSLAITTLNETLSILEDTLKSNFSLEVVYDFLSRLYKEENMYTEAFYELSKLLDLRIRTITWGKNQ